MRVETGHEGRGGSLEDLPSAAGMGHDAAAAAVLGAGECVDRARRGGGDSRRSIAEMLAEVAMAAAAASSTSVAADAAASAAKLAAETAQAAASEAREASASAAAVAAAATEIARKTASLHEALKLEFESSSAATGLFGDILPKPSAGSPDDGPECNGAVQNATSGIAEVGDNVTTIRRLAPIAAVSAAKNKITNVRDLLETGLLEGERIVYQQKKKGKVLLEGRIKGLLYSCLCHDEAMSATQFEMHANGRSNNSNDHILCWGQSLYNIVHQLRTMPAKDQIPAVLKMKDGNERRAEKVQAKGNVTAEEELSVLKDANGSVISAQIFTFCQLAAATGNFSDECFIREGGFGRVYKGRLDGTGQVVAIKQLNRDGNEGNKKFLVEVLMLSLLHHENLVNLVGYCADGDHHLLAYEYMPLGSLEDHLHDLPPDKEPLDWNTRMKIAAGAAKGLEYLHDKAQPPVIYRDFKSSNILLDEDFHPKLSDFGLTNLDPIGDKSNVSAHVMGTHGYCAPEYAMTGQLTAKSDVYSFGVVLLELITGRKAIDSTRPAAEQNLVQWAMTVFNDRQNLTKMADPGLQGRFPTRGLYQALVMASMCIQSEAASRPVISDVVTTLSYLANQIYDPNGTNISKKACDSDQQSSATDSGRALSKNDDTNSSGYKSSNKEQADSPKEHQDP